MKLAIIIPFYKKDFFEKTLQSLDNQTNKEFNLYIGNDNSPYNIDLIISKYSHIITSYKKFDKNIGGKSLANQWNRCYDSFIGNEEWFTILCDDDYLSENYVECFYNKISVDTVLNTNIIKGQIVKVDKNEKFLYSKTYQLQQETAESFYLNYLLGNYDSTISENIFRTSTFNKHRFKHFDLAFGSDIVAVLDVAENKPIFFLEGCCLFFRLSDINISGISHDSIIKKRKFKANLQQTKYIIKNFSFINRNSVIKDIAFRNYYQFTRSVSRYSLKENVTFFYLFIKYFGIFNFQKIVTFKNKTQ